MMRICRGCGGVLGKDCFHEQDCMWITADIEQKMQYDSFLLREQQQYMEALHEEWEESMLEESWFNFNIIK